MLKGGGLVASGVEGKQPLGLDEQPEGVFTDVLLCQHPQPDHWSR